MRYLALIILMSTTNALAAPSGEQGPITDLTFPAINFSVIFILLFVLLRKPIKAAFEKNADDVTSLYKHAEEKDKEAQLKLAQFEQKVGTLEAETQKLLDQAKLEAEKVRATIEQETVAQMAKMADEAKQKAEYEKNMMIKELNESLLEQVISKTKEAIKGNKDLQSKATDNLAGGV